MINVLVARVRPNDFSKKGVKTNSLIFFSSIAKYKTLSKYSLKLKKCTSEQLEDDIISQIYVCSLICDKKFWLYQKGLIISLVGVIVFVIMAVIGAVLV